MTPFPIGSQWRTRAGHRAVVVDISGGYLCVWHSAAIHIQVHTPNGVSLEYREFDLLTPWAEPQKGEFWVNVYEDGFCEVHPTRKEAFEMASKNAIALKKIVWEEGQFDE